MIDLALLVLETKVTFIVLLYLFQKFNIYLFNNLDIKFILQYHVYNVNNYSDT